MLVFFLPPASLIASANSFALASVSSQLAALKLEIFAFLDDTAEQRRRHWSPETQFKLLKLTLEGKFVLIMWESAYKCFCGALCQFLVPLPRPPDHQLHV